MADIVCFRTGHCRHPSCIALAGSGLRPRSFHSHAYLLKTARGLLLFDIGYAPRFHTASARGPYRLYPLVTPATCAMPLRAQLEAYGVDPAEISTIVVSHFHADHVAGLLDFPAAGIVCSGQAWRAVQGLTGLAAVRRAFLPDLLPKNVRPRLRLLDPADEVLLPDALRPFVVGYDIGQGELLAVPLPGHAEGQLGLFVRTGDNWTLLAADAAWHGDSLRTNRGPSQLSFLVQHDRKAYYHTLALLRSLYITGRVRIRLSHDDEPDFTPSKDIP